MAWCVCCVPCNFLTLYTVLLWTVALSLEGCGFFAVWCFSRDWLVLFLWKRMPKHRLGDFSHMMVERQYLKMSVYFPLGQASST